MAEIVIAEFMDAAVVADLFAGRDVLFDPDLVDRPEALANALADCRALIVRNRTQVRGALLEAAPRLEVVGRLGVGLDNIDLEACEARRIAVHPAIGANDAAVAEWVITAAMLLLRPAFLSSGRVAAGEWPRIELVGREIGGKTLGLVGFGSIAQLTAAKALALGMDVCAHDPYLAPDDPAWARAEQLDLDGLLARADVVSLHVPLSEETRCLIGVRELTLMKPDAVLVNAARGGVLDEAALAAALRENRLAGAALDVFEHEPLDAAAGARFAGVPHLVLTPHVAGVTEESNGRVSRAVAQGVLRVLRG